METRVMLTLVIEDDTIYGECRVSVSRWDGPQLVMNSAPYRAPAILRPIEPDESVFPYAVAALREGTDNAIASMLEQMGKSEVLLMHQVELAKET